MYLLDTNVVSEVRQGKPRPSAAVLAWAASVAAPELHIPSIAVTELEIGVQRLERRDARQGAALRDWLEGVLRAFDGRVVAFDREAARLCASLHVPNPRSYPDSMIAATARRHRFTLVTRNAANFQGCGVEVLNPWDFRS